MAINRRSDLSRSLRRNHAEPGRGELVLTILTTTIASSTTCQWRHEAEQRQTDVEREPEDAIIKKKGPTATQVCHDRNNGGAPGRRGYQDDHQDDKDDCLEDGLGDRPSMDCWA